METGVRLQNQRMEDEIVEKAESEPQVAVGIRENIVDIYEDLFDTIWGNITPTLGAITVATIVERAVRRTAVEHEMIGLLTVNHNKVDFSQLKRAPQDSDQVALREGLNLLVANLLDILAKLTGNVLVDELMKVVEEKLWRARDD
jgi:hypothetical protein